MLLALHELCIRDQPHQPDPLLGEKRFHRFQRCGSNAWVIQDRNDHERFAVQANYCRDRFCIPCATNRARIINANLLDLIAEAPTRFITLTIRHRDASLGSEIDRLNAAFQRLRRSDLWIKRVDSWVAFLEVERNQETSTWHPHLHLVTKGKYIDHSQLKAAWMAATGDSFIVDIRLVRNKKTIAQYVTKYVSKPIQKLHQAKHDDLIEAILALKNRKLVRCGGEWTNAELTDSGAVGDWQAVCRLWWAMTLEREGNPIATKLMRALRHFRDTDQPGSRIDLPPPDPLLWSD
jgi:hypothetical protein